MSHLKPEVSDLDHRAGPENAPVTLVEYGDYECPYCGSAHPIVERVRKELGPRLRFVFRHFPLKEIHPHALMAAQAAEAAAAQGKFWEMHDLLYDHQTALDESHLLGYAKKLELDAARFQKDLEAGVYAQRVRADFRSGVRSGVNGTPTFFVNGDRLDGSWYYNDLMAAVERAGAVRK